MLTDRVKVYAMAYAMARQYDEGDPLAITGGKAIAVVCAFAARLRCTYGELCVAVTQVSQQDDEPEQPPAPEDQQTGMKIGEFSASLAAAVGGDPSFWERRCAASYTYSVLHAIAAQNQADGRANPSDPRLAATRALGWAAEKIRRNRAEQAKVTDNG